MAYSIFDPKTKQTIYLTEMQTYYLNKFVAEQADNIDDKQISKLMNDDSEMQRAIGLTLYKLRAPKETTPTKVIPITPAKVNIESDNVEKPRASWDEYFMDIAKLVSTRTTCFRRAVGAVAVDKNHRVLGTGYNGAPSGLTHCTKANCIRIQQNIPSGERSELCKAIHAEQNLVIHLGEQLAGATVYVTTRPCTTCTKLLIGCGVEEIVWEQNYNDEYATTILTEYQIRSEFDKSPVITQDKFGYYHFKRNP